MHAPDRRRMGPNHYMKLNRFASLCGIVFFLVLSPFSLASFSAEEEARLTEKALVESLSTPEQKDLVRRYLQNLAKKKRNEAAHLRELASAEPKLSPLSGRKKKLLDMAEQLDREASIHEETLRNLAAISAN